ARRTRRGTLRALAVIHGRTTPTPASGADTGKAHEDFGATGRSAGARPLDRPPPRSIDGPVPQRLRSERSDRRALPRGRARREADDPRVRPEVRLRVRARRPFLPVPDAMRDVAGVDPADSRGARGGPDRRGDPGRVRRGFRAGGAHGPAARGVQPGRILPAGRGDRRGGAAHRARRQGYRAAGRGGGLFRSRDHGGRDAPPRGPPEARRGRESGLVGPAGAGSEAVTRRVVYEAPRASDGGSIGRTKRWSHARVRDPARVLPRRVG